MKSDAVTEVSFTFKEPIDRFLSCCREPYMINSVLESFILRRFSLIQLLMLASVFSITLTASISEILDPL